MCGMCPLWVCCMVCDMCDVLYVCGGVCFVCAICTGGVGCSVYGVECGSVYICVWCGVFV